MSLNVLHVLDTSIPDTAGYTTRGYYLVKHQKELGLNPVILTSERFRGKSISTKEELEGISYYRSTRKNKLVRKVPGVAQWDEIQDLKKRVDEVGRIKKIDIVHAHSPSLIGEACYEYCRNNQVPFVYEIRAFWEDAAVDRRAFRYGSLQYRLRRWHETRIVQKADAVVTISEGLREDLRARVGKSKLIQVVRNGVDSEYFKPLARDSELSKTYQCQNKKVLGFIGSFFRFEGLQFAMQSMRTMLSRCPEILFLLVGAGEMDQELRQMVRQYNLENNVVFTGRVPHNDVAKYYSIIDVLVYPRLSRRITELVTPLKPLEAMAMGKAVLMSDVGGLKELVTQSGVASFFRAEDNRDFEDKCLELLIKNDKRYGLERTARTYVEKFWAWKSRAREYVDLYQDLVTPN